MRVVIFRAEKEKIHFMDCELKAESVIVGDKGKISLETARSSGEKYKLIMDGVATLIKKYFPDKLVYRSGQGFRGNIDEIRYTNEAMLTYFAYANEIDVEELTQSGVRKKLGIKNPEFKSLLEKETKELIAEYGFAKSDKILESLVFVSVLRSL
jgi:hypothetical protein